MLMLAVLTVAVTAACGGTSSGSANPNTLLKETFTGKHTVTSGNIDLTLTIDPSGHRACWAARSPSPSAVRSRAAAAGKLPESNFTVSGSALGRNVWSAIISTGTAGYVTFEGASYQLPAATLPEARVELLAAGVHGRLELGVERPCPSSGSIR